MQSLSLPEAQKLALLSQGLLSQELKGQAYQRTLKAMSNLGYVQIDTISVVQRAHHHTLWSRNPKYQLDHLDKMLKEKHIYEYWSHAASFLSMKDFRFSLPRKHAIKSDQQKHWFRKDKQLMKAILDRITSEGPLMAKDFESEVTKTTGWESKPTKQALEMLYMQGDLMIFERRNFHKVYDITERVLPSSVDTSLPTANEHARFLIQEYLNKHGLGQLKEITYLLKDVKPTVKVALNEMLEEGEVVEVTAGDERYYTTNQTLSLLNFKLKRKQAKILSPFDNFLIQRARIKHLFNFDYLLECYTPVAKRQYGYFSLPILWNGKLVGRVDCKAHRLASRLDVISLHLEPSHKDSEAFREAFRLELERFARFNQVDTINDYQDAIYYK
ncbi:winged helix-turn-helix domain-containing protein [Vibrio astriarenae]|uniref:winged helix-turn-helix domain-containing protein n=1 Tax=Vibrio astriarenae TaxID=1481923 RepID=UPI0037356337